MDILIKKISNILSFIVVFVVSAVFYFNFKGYVLENGQIVLQMQPASAETFTVLPRNIAVNASTKYAKGSAKAPLTLYEYSSLGCPHCADFHLDTMPKIEEEYVDKGLLRVVFVNFPLDKNSMKAALLSECMTYENYFAFLDEVFDQQRSWWMDSDNTKLFQIAAEYGLSYDEALSCISDDNKAQQIVTDRQEAISRLNMQGTPAFLFTGSDGNEIFYGTNSYNEIKKYLDNRLAGLGK